MSHKIEDILDECLQLLAQGRTVEECLSRYPEQAGALEPLLRTAVAGQRAMASPQPSPTAQAAGRQHLLTALAARGRQRRRFLPLRGWALAAASLVLALFLGTGTVLASFQSVPEEPLYPVKRAVEQVQLALAPSPMSEARTLVEHSDNRLKEIEALEERGNAPAAEALRQRMKSQLRRATILVIAVEQRGGDGGVVIVIMERNLAWHRARLERGEETPQALMGALEEAATEEAPAPTTAPGFRPAQPHPGLKQRPGGLPPQRARPALQKALNDYEAALQQLKTELRRHNGKLPWPSFGPREIELES